MAVMNAIADAIGGRIYTLPATPAKVKAVIDGVASGKPEVIEKWRLGSDMYDVLEDIKNNPV